MHRRTMKTMAIVVLAVLTLGIVPARAHIESPLVLRSIEHTHSNYLEDSQKLAIEGYLVVGNQSDVPRNASCRLVLTLREVDGTDSRRVAKQVNFWVPERDERYKEWRTVVADWGGRWRMGRTENAAVVRHCQVVRS